jgi:hypothetical protein
MCIFSKVCCCISFPFSKFLYVCWWLHGAESYDNRETTSYIFVLTNFVNFLNLGWGSGIHTYTRTNMEFFRSSTFPFAEKKTFYLDICS